MEKGRSDNNKEVVKRRESPPQPQPQPPSGPSSSSSGSEESPGPSAGSAPLDAAIMNSKGQYPTQPSYSVQPPGNPSVFQQTIPLPQAPPYTDAPPAYSELYRPNFVHPGAATVPTMSAAYPGASLYLPMAQSMAMGPMGSSVPMAFYPMGPVYPPGSAVLVEGGFDAGARFAPGAPANIPPPPPGLPPNAAQLAVMQGANVLVTQRKGNYFLGSSDGGYTIW